MHRDRMRSTNQSIAYAHSITDAHKLWGNLPSPPAATAAGVHHSDGES